MLTVNSKYKITFKEKRMKLNYKRTILVGFAFFLICAFWQAYDNIVPLILKHRFDMSETWSGVIMALDNVFAVFLLPIFGNLSDKTHSRFGRRTPYIVIGTAAAAIFFSILGFVETLPVFIAILLGSLLSMSVFRSPAVALMPDVTVKPLRSKANAVINLMGTAGGIIILLLATPFHTSDKDKTDFGPYLLATVGVMLIGLVVFLLTVREPKWVKDMEEESAKLGRDAESEERDERGGHLSRSQFTSLLLLLASVALWYIGYNAVTSKYSVYATDILGVSYSLTLLIAQGAAIVSYIPVGMLASKFGRKKTILAGVALLTLSFAGAYFVQPGTSEVLMYVLFSLAGIGWATINVNSFPMVVELAKGSDVGKYTCYYYTASMAAQVVTPVLSGALMDNFGMRNVFFPYAAIACALAFVTMVFVRHGDSKPASAASKLEALDVDMD